jgi:ligand-binding SRPBCC domain-containing protein
MQMVYRLERATFIPKPRGEVFRFFSDAHNLERITPAFLQFKILTPDPIEMKPGTLIEYKLRLHGVPVRWKTLIAEFVPDDYFVDVQLSGPYRSWHHRHDFLDAPGGTEMRDRVDYEMPFGVIGSIVHRFFVRRSVNSIFDHRNASIAQFLG